MCGIAGIVRFDGREVSEPDLRQFCRVMTHRGPDQSGTFTDVQSGLSVGFGTVRLAIQDLSPAGSQPMASADGNLCVAYNGETYNHPSLKAGLEARGARYRSRSDTETVLHAYEAWGPDFLPRLDAMFALALYDRRARRVLLARDRMGIKPLYYYQTPDALYFASELKVLLAHPDVPRRVDRRALQVYLTLGYVPSPLCLIEGIRKLPPGASLTAAAGGRVSLQKFWTALEVDEAAGRRSDADLERELRTLLEEAVTDQLISDVPVGAALSGGVDSTIVTALAQRHHDGPLDTFAVGFRAGPGQAPVPPMYNWDLEHARLVTQELGTRHHEVLIDTGPGLLDELRPLVAQMDEPVWEGSFLSIFKLSKLAREHGIIVMMTGDGGDELFAGYEHLWGSVRQTQLDTLPLLRPALALARPFAGLGGLAKRIDRVRRRLALGTLEGYRQNYELIPEAERAALTGERVNSLELLAGVLAPALGGRARELPELMARADFDLWLREHFNTRLDRMSMATSVEARVPLQANKVVDFALALPLARRASLSEPKRLLRRAAADVLPDIVARRQKRPFAVPGASWLMGTSGQAFHEVLSPERVRAAGVIEPSAVAASVSRASEAGVRANHRVWCLLWLQLWAEQVLAERPGAVYA